MTRIYIVDDHPILRTSLRSVLDREPDLKVCGEAETGRAALEEAGDAAPDLVLIDVSLPDMSGIEVARALRERHPDVPLAMLSGHGERSHVEQALEAGARGYILKEDSAELAGAVRSLVRGERYLSAGLGEMD